MRRIVLLLLVQLLFFCRAIFAADMFLTYPFNQSGINLQQGWIYMDGGTNAGIDYINGSINDSPWDAFDVVTSHDGTAIYSTGWNGGYGNYVRVTTTIGGTTYQTRYAHLESSPLAEGQSITVHRGDIIGVTGMSGAANGVNHLHFELLVNGAKTDPYGLYANRTSYPENGGNCGSVVYWSSCPPVLPIPYHCKFHRQDPPAAEAPWLKPGDISTYTVSFENDGALTWKNVPGPGYIELWSALSGGTAPTRSLLNASGDVPGWISDSKVGTMLYPSVAHKQNAWWIFSGKVPADKPTGEYPVYFRPWIQDANPQLIQDWGGMNFLVKVDATSPTAPTNVTANPTSNNVNSFGFTWTAGSDAHSGVAGYYWNINGGGESFTTAISLPVGAYATVQGANTFNVRTKDNVGNYSGYASVGFSYNPGGCGPPLPSCVLASSDWQGTGNREATITDEGIIRLMQGSPSDRAIVRQPAVSVVTPGALYRIGFSYRTSGDSRLEWGLGNEESEGPVVFWVIPGRFTPIADGNWHQFWSAPFVATERDLADHPMLILSMEKGSKGTIEVQEAGLYRQPETDSRP